MMPQSHSPDKAAPAMTAVAQQRRVRQSLDRSFPVGFVLAE
jgi:hypothetical protein